MLENLHTFPVISAIKLKHFRIQLGSSLNLTGYHRGPSRAAELPVKVSGSGELLTASLGWKSHEFFYCSFHCMLIKQMLCPDWISVTAASTPWQNSDAKTSCCPALWLSTENIHLTPRLSTNLLDFNTQLEALISLHSQRWFNLSYLLCVVITWVHTPSVASSPRRLCKQKIASSFPNQLESIEGAFLSVTPFIFSNAEVTLNYKSLRGCINVGTVYRGSHLWNKWLSNN